jgi:hypothetical protein
MKGTEPRVYRELEHPATSRFGDCNTYGDKQWPVSVTGADHNPDKSTPVTENRSNRLRGRGRQFHCVEFPTYYETTET